LFNLYSRLRLGRDRVVAPGLTLRLQKLLFGRRRLGAGHDALLFLLFIIPIALLVNSLVTPVARLFAPSPAAI
jgi:hypothetical protein